MGKMFENGDILVFKAGDEWISKCIARLTASDVSHAAMVYRDETMVEMGLSGIHLTPVTVNTGDGAYLMRLNPEQDSQPLIAAAEVYLNAQTRYDIPALVILGGLIIYRAIRPTPEFVVIADLILRAASRALDKLIQSVVLHNKEKAMVCSQLVYQIYDDCGRDYRIHLEGGTLQSGSEAAVSQPRNSTVRLIEKIDRRKIEQEADMAESRENFSGYKTSKEPKELIESIESFENVGEEQAEELSRLLYEAMETWEEQLTASHEHPASPNENLTADFQPLLKPAKKLLEQLEKFLEKIKSDIPIDALFVTPADFVYHAKNLVQVTTLDVKKNI